MCIAYTSGTCARVQYIFFRKIQPVSIMYIFFDNCEISPGSASGQCVRAVRPGSASESGQCVRGSVIIQNSHYVRTNCRICGQCVRAVRPGSASGQCVRAVRPGSASEQCVQAVRPGQCHNSKFSLYANQL